MVERVEADVGVYALVNRRAGLVYIGSSRTLRRRRYAWRYRLRSLEYDICPENVHRRFFEAAKGLPFADWEFLVLERFDALVDRETISRAEYRYVGCIERLWPRSMLNSVTFVEREFDHAANRRGGVPYVRGTRYRIGDAVEPSRYGLKSRLTARDQRVLRWLATWCRFRGLGRVRPYRTRRVLGVLFWLAEWCRF